MFVSLALQDTNLYAPEGRTQPQCDDLSLCWFVARFLPVWDWVEEEESFLGGAWGYLSLVRPPFCYKYRRTSKVEVSFFFLTTATNELSRINPSNAK